MNAQTIAYPRRTQHHPVSLILMTIAPLTFSLSLATFAQAQESVANAASQTESDPADRDSADKDRQGHDSADKAVKELSVAPLDVVKYPADRPRWIGSPADTDGEIHSLVAVSQPSETQDESLASLKMMRRIAVQLYANKLILADGHPEPFVLSEDWIAKNVDRFVAREYEGTLKQGDMDLYEHAVELHFSADAQEEIRHQWKNVEVRGRLGALGFLVFLGTVLTGCGSAALGVFSRRLEQKQRATMSP